MPSKSGLVQARVAVAVRLDGKSRRTEPRGEPRRERPEVTRVARRAGQPVREAAAGVVLLRHVDACGDEPLDHRELVAPAGELRGRDAALGARVRVDAGPFNKILDDGEVAVPRRVVERGPAARRRRVAAPRRVCWK